jgi:hypothetical protein
MKLIRILSFLTLLWNSVLSAQAQNNDAPLAANAPKDKVVSIYDGQLRQMDSVMAPYIAQAKASYGKAKGRFVKGLPAGEAFFVVTRIFDTDGKFEQVFIRVKAIDGEKVSGTIANDLETVREYKSNQLVAFEERNVIDWLITKPNGSEEGNFIGKYLDSKH